MKTSELSLLYNSLFKELYKKLPGNYRFETDEKPNEFALSNQEEYNNIKNAVDSSKNPSTEKESKDASKNGKTKKYSEAYEVNLSINPDKKGLSKEQNYIKNKISSTYARGNSNPYLNLLEEFSNDYYAKDEKNPKNLGDELHLNLEDFIYLRDIGVYPVNKLMILRRFLTPPASPDLVHLRNKSVRMGRPISKVIGWVKNDDDIFNISFNEVWKTQDKWLHELIVDIINDQFGINIANIFPMPGWGQSLVFGFMNRMGWTDYGGNNLPIGDPNLLRTGITRETDGTGLATNMSLKLETTYELKYIQNVDPTTVFYSIINNLLNMGTSNIKFLFKGGSNISNLQNFVTNPNLTSLIALVSGAINDILREVTNVLSKIKANNQYKKAQEEQATNEKQNKNELRKNENIEIKGSATPKKNDKGNIIGSEPVELKDGSIWSANNYNEYSAAVSEKKALDKSKNDKQLENEAKSSVKKTGFLDKMLSMASSVVNAESIVKYITGFLNDILASTISRYEWPMKGAIAQATGMNMTPWHLTIGNPKAPIISMNYIKVDSVEIKLSGDLFYNDLPRYITATISISNARPFGKQEILKFFGNTFIREYSSSVKFIGQEINMESIEKLISDESAKVSTKASEMANRNTNTTTNTTATNS